jgi:hypothetical protein
MSYRDKLFKGSLLLSLVLVVLDRATPTNKQTNKLVGEKRAAQVTGTNHVEGEICYMRRSNNYNQDNRSNNKNNNQDNRSNNKNNNQTESRSKDGLCYAHNRYGEQAWSCEQPCKWSKALVPRPGGSSDGREQLNTIFPFNYSVHRVAPEPTQHKHVASSTKRRCFYHHKFGKRARKCAGPSRCSWRRASRVPPKAVSAVAPAGGGSNLHKEQEQQQSPEEQERQHERRRQETEKEWLEKKQQQYETYKQAVHASHQFRAGLINPSEEELRMEASLYHVLAK